MDNKGNYPIVIVADEAMMRGVDYRSDGKGLLLVINKTFTTNRDAEQGLARVGRFGDQGCRVLVKGIELVDKISNAEKYNTFFRFAQSAILPLKPDRKRTRKAEDKATTAMSSHTSQISVQVQASPAIPAAAKVLQPTTGILLSTRFSSSISTHSKRRSVSSASSANRKPGQSGLEQFYKRSEPKDKV